MSLTAIVWACLAVGTCVLSLKRPVWAVAFYMLTYFAAPHLWWWGDDLPSFRYAFWAGIWLLIVVVFHSLTQSGTRLPGTDGGLGRTARFAAAGMVLNATVVHFLIAAEPDISLDTYVELLKYVLLFFLLKGAIRDRGDLRIALISIALGAAYIGYEVTINERGDFNGARLEGVGAPGAQDANGLAQLMLITLPLVGSLVLNKSIISKVAGIGAAPLVLNVLLLCNSRGAFLGLAGAAGSFVMVARGVTRKKAIQTLALGGVVLYLLLGDPKILDRFSTTFVGSEARDNSAAGRIDFWRASALMIIDYPLGAGGGAFKFIYGPRYLTAVTGDQEPDARSIHNGYLTEATDWGVQGLFFKLLFMGAALLATYRTTNRARLDGRINDSLIGICVFVAGAGGMIHCIFGSFLANEYMYRLAAILLRYSELYARELGSEATGTFAKAA